MKHRIRNRPDLMAIFNKAAFTLRHYAMGCFPVSNREPAALPVNRMFFPISNPGGELNFMADRSRRYVLVPGNMYFIPAFLPAVVSLDENLFFLSIQANMELFPGVELFSGCSRMLEVPIGNELEMLRSFFESESGNAHVNAVRAGALAFNILASTLEHYPASEFWNALALKEYGELTEYLEKHGNAGTSVAELARARNESREHFTRRFIARTGITPKQLIDRFVIGRCLTLINQGLSFKEIASLLMFRDEYALSRYFKRNMGEPPKIWRQRQFPPGIL